MTAFDQTMIAPGRRRCGGKSDGNFRPRLAGLILESAEDQ